MVVFSSIVLDLIFKSVRRDSPAESLPVLGSGSAAYLSDSFDTFDSAFADDDNPDEGRAPEPNVEPDWTWSDELTSELAWDPAPRPRVISRDAF